MPAHLGETRVKRTLLAAAAAMVFIVCAAQAADMALKEPPPAAWTWTGFYLGGEVGGRWQSSRWNTTCIESGFPGAACPNATVLPADAARFNVNNPQSFNSGSVWGGVVAGYNWQVTNWLLGIEGNFAWGNNTATHVGIPGAESPTVAGAPGFDNSNVKETWDGSLRLRGGFLVTPETLVYVTGGAAFTQVEFSAYCATPYPVGWCAGAGDLGQRSTSTSIRAGWTVGGGIETRIMGNWLGRAEYRYADYGSASGALFGGPAGFATGDTINASVRVRSNIGLLGVVYKY
jgi:outer membrane immunogenic protein